MIQVLRTPDTQWLSEADIYADVAAVYGNDMGVELTRGSAVNIAAWWQSPGAIGHVLAQFASGLPTDRAELLDDIHATRTAGGYFNGTMAERDKNALDCLSTFVIHYGEDSDDE